MREQSLMARYNKYVSVRDATMYDGEYIPMALTIEVLALLRPLTPLSRLSMSPC